MLGSAALLLLCQLALRSCIRATSFSSLGCCIIALQDLHDVSDAVRAADLSARRHLPGGTEPAASELQLRRYVSFSEHLQAILLGTALDSLIMRSRAALLRQFLTNLSRFNRSSANIIFHCGVAPFHSQDNMHRLI